MQAHRGERAVGEPPGECPLTGEVVVHDLAGLDDGDLVVEVGGHRRDLRQFAHHLVEGGQGMTSHDHENARSAGGDGAPCEFPRDTATAQWVGGADETHRLDPPDASVVEQVSDEACARRVVHLQTHPVDHAGRGGGIGQLGRLYGMDGQRPLR